MAAQKTSAVSDEPIDVLFALHPKFDLLDFAGPLEVFTSALHDAKDESEWAQTSFHLDCSSVTQMALKACPLPSC